MIKIRNLTKIYGNHSALQNVSLDIGVGEFVFLVGSSGAGKSTLMRHIYREEQPTSGQIFVGGVNVAKIPDNQIPDLRRCMGIVFQDYKLLEKQTVFDNVAFLLRTMGMSSKEVNTRVNGALKIVGLSHKVLSKPTELSGGEQQRVGIARAIVNGPPLLIADEPTGNLDPKTSLEIVNILEKVNQRGITVVMSTHDHAIVDYFKKRVITLEQGRVIKDVQDGTYE